MKNPLKVAAVQFEMAQNDKPRNLQVMAGFVEQAAGKGADVVAFPELCLCGYHFLTELGRPSLLKIAERTDDGEAVTFMRRLARRHKLHILFGLLEKDARNRLYNTYVAVGPKGRLFQHRKVHAFENSAIRQGDRLDTFDLLGWTCGILICYDNNLPENGRVLCLKGAELVFAPHQTGGFDIPRAGMGRISLELWRNRHKDPLPMREAILGLKGRAWIAKWLPARAYDNNCYLVFANGVGGDGPEVRVGCSMILDPEGIVIAETTEAEDDLIIAELYKEKRVNSLASSHIAARRPSLYGKIVEPIPETDTRTIRNRISGEKIV
ncbi:MAG: nitrilase [Planctomycetota bacterium]|nr:nitrilase [Planctomycetota bacterium]